jgi:hypothetical protein
MDTHRLEKFIRDLIASLRDSFGLSESMALKLLTRAGFEEKKAEVLASEDGMYDMMEVNSANKSTSVWE